MQFAPGLPDAQPIPLPSQPRHAGLWLLERPLLASALTLTFASFVLRSALFGDPIAGFDEQLYLLIGTRMWDGAVPYVDLWDRKPAGLFAWFALLSAFGNGLVVSQVAGAIFATATSWFVTRISLRYVPFLPALMAGLLYLLFLHQLDGQTTQTPVFYNLFTVIAAWQSLRIAETPQSHAAHWRAALAMLLCGLAIQFKPSAVFEGVFFGLFIGWRMYRAGVQPASLVGRLALYALLGLAPSLVATACFAATDHFDAYWYANVLSVFERKEALSGPALKQLVISVSAAGPVILAGLAGIAIRCRHTGFRDESAWLVGWLGTTAVDFVALGCFWHHYLLPALLPLSIGAASLFAIERRRMLVFILLAAWPTIMSLIFDRIGAMRDREGLTAILAEIPDAVRQQCMFVYEGQAVYYDLTHACTVTRFVFPDHLRSSRDANGLGVDASDALRAALARKPLVILKEYRSSWKLRNRVNDQILAETLARDYHLAAQLPQSTSVAGHDQQQIWIRNGAPASTAHISAMRRLGALN